MLLLANQTYFIYNVFDTGLFLILFNVCTNNISFFPEYLLRPCVVRVLGAHKLDMSTLFTTFFL